MVTSLVTSINHNFRRGSDFSLNIVKLFFVWKNIKLIFFILKKIILIFF
jgi:hypothetical protein